MINPYENVEWSNIERIISTNHWHCLNVDRFWAIYNTGLQHFALSNYLPSHVTYPLDNQMFFDLSAEEVPRDIIQSPNTEKPKIAGSKSMHFGTIGSFYENPGHLWDESLDGAVLTWQEQFDLTFSELQYSDGGGVIVNHPLRTNMSVDDVIEKLKYNKTLVLGVEVMNYRSQRDYNLSGYYFVEWDKILSRGIRCYGFFSTDEHVLPPEYKEGQDMRDYGYGLGRNVMLTDNYDSHEVLKSYQNGQFYGAFYGDRITFTEINHENDEFIVKTDDAERIDFISYSIKDGEVVKNDVISINNNEAVFTIDENMIFCRASAYENEDDHDYKLDVEGERIYTQPIMFKTEAEVNQEISDWEDEQKRKNEYGTRKKVLLLSG